MKSYWNEPDIKKLGYENTMKNSKGSKHGILCSHAPNSMFCNNSSPGGNCHYKNKYQGKCIVGGGS